MFKVGDRVRYIDYDLSYELIMGKIYTVDNVWQDKTMSVQGSERVFLQKRFVKVGSLEDQYAICNNLYGSDSIKSPNDVKDQVLEDFAEAMEEVDFEHLSDLSTKRLTKKEEYDIMVVLSKLTWEDLK